MRLALALAIILSACNDGTESPDARIPAVDGSAVTPDSEVPEFDAAETTPDAEEIQVDAEVRDGPGPQDSSGTGVDANCSANLAFGASCTDNCECESDLCHLFPGEGSLCTISCTDNTQCPTGTQGQKCNNQNVCRP